MFFALYRKKSTDLKRINLSQLFVADARMPLWNFFTKTFSLPPLTHAWKLWLFPTFCCGCPYEKFRFLMTLLGHPGQNIVFALIKKIFLQTLVEIIYRYHNFFFFRVMGPGYICIYIGGLIGYIFVYIYIYIFIYIHIPKSCNLQLMSRLSLFY